MERQQTEARDQQGANADIAPRGAGAKVGGTTNAAQLSEAPAGERAGPVASEVFGVRIVGNGTSAKAVEECANFVTRMVGRNKLAQKKLREKKVTLVIIPHDKKMTDLPQFAALAGTNTFDGRLWDDVRGSGGMTAPDGSWAIGVPEENLTVIAGANDGYGAGYSVGMHEFAHTLHSQGLTSAQQGTITRLYAARKAAGGPWTEAYGASNEQEYFAQCTNCYFGKNQGIGHNGKEWLRTNDPPMCDFLDEIYGKAYDQEGNQVPG